MNLTILAGHLGKDVEVRYLPSGDPVANFTVATKETWNDRQSGERKEATEWHDCVAFDKTAELIAQYFKKGSGIELQGKIKTQNWVGANSEKKSRKVIEVNHFFFPPSSPRPSNGASETGTNGQGKSAGKSGNGGTGRPAPSFSSADDEIPFA